MYNNWPPRLPTPDLLRHLLHTFFVSHPHASRLLHRPTFMASLDHPPNHPNFPTLSLLHAICALTSIWSPLVEQESMPDLQTRPAEEIFQERERQRLREERARHGLGPQGGEHRGEWFGEMHARFSREEEEKGAADGIGVFQGLQCEFSLDVQQKPFRNSYFLLPPPHIRLLIPAIVVLTWYYYAHARWVEVWLYTAKAMRYAVPMGLNVTSTHGPLLRSWTMPSILAPPRDHIEVGVTPTAAGCGELGQRLTICPNLYRKKCGEILFGLPTATSAGRQLRRAGPWLSTTRTSARSSAVA
jgi:hypothetical protein